MKHTRTLFTILSWPVYICIAAYLLIAAPLILGYHPVVVLSGSMEPAFPVGSIIYYKETPCDKIQAGEIITFHAGDGGSLVTHRVVENRQLSGEFIRTVRRMQAKDVSPELEFSVSMMRWRIWDMAADTICRVPPVWEQHWQ